MMSELHDEVGRQLGELGAAYAVMACDPDFADTAAFCERYGVAPQDSANTIVVASRRPPDVFGVCVALATTRLDVNRAVRDALDVKKLSFASAEVTLELTGMEIGGVTPFGLPSGLAVLVDSAVMDRDEIVLGGGNRSSKLRMAPAELLRLPDVRVIDGLATGQ
jgi:prolyl-tRNA editing enzyme YbaK/EbsC (Cys-tRNA(Pro) deacylase)